jgi:hypothetical protein
MSQFVNLRVLCVIRRDQILTRVIRQNVEREFGREEYGLFRIESCNSPELRLSEGVLFVRGNHLSEDHRVHRTYKTEHEIEAFKRMAKRVNEDYHEASI